MREVMLLKDGEITLKGLNRNTFETALILNVKRRLDELGKYNITKAQSAMFIEPENEDFDIDEAINRVKKIFGYVSISRAAVVEKNIDVIKSSAANYLRETLENVSSFKVTAKRADKRFPLTSPQICTEVGGYLLEHFKNLHVDVHNPEFTVVVEIRDFGAYIHGAAVPGAGGLPVGTSGKAAILISGGIDSPVAAYMMAKRGLSLHAIHFESPPYTSERARLKVLKLLQIVSEYSGKIVCHVVPFTRIQEEIKNNCQEDFFTVIMRRFMMKIASEIAAKNGCKALITGESLGQVASQTIEAISCTQEAARLPVFRPLIGMDKEEIVRISRAIGTFDTSVEPYEDCCTVFTPRHPRTRPILEYVKSAESAYDFAPLVKAALEDTKTIEINPKF
jgi:thiamine biosynthesis protein ThiI